MINPAFAPSNTNLPHHNITKYLIEATTHNQLLWIHKINQKTQTHHSYEERLSHEAAKDTIVSNMLSGYG